MALLSRADLVEALGRLGGLAAADGLTLDLVVVGGAVMVLEFGTRLSTRDVDAVATRGADASVVRRYATVVARERGWPADWLNDGAKGYLTGAVTPSVLLSLPGINVLRPAIEQLLAMKLCAWRDDVDIADAGRLLHELPDDRSQAWSMVVPFLQPGRELKARYAFDALWEART